MKYSLFALAAVVGTAYAGAPLPKLSISVRDGKFDGLDGLDPTLNWSGSSSSGDVDLSYGIESSVRPTSDLASLPRNVWGKASTNVAGWGVSARAEVDAQKRRSANIELDADNKDVDLSLRMVASAGGDFSVRRIEATKGLDVNGARVTINPRYNVENETPDVVIGYRNDQTNVELTASAANQEVKIGHQIKDNTNIKLTASAANQELTISQQINDNNRVAPTVSRNGDISVQWERSLGDDNSLTTTLKPNDSIDFEWKDAAWTANVNMPLDGASINGANVSIKRDVSF
jgi:hypothetical protein